ncbi:diguanylate cyclase [Oceaniserpentilla sp. 4NH20-0058]|uniref:diguanylate cyclase n=1 Tax=Oceaniserpentilla sp. 4NH20-0058 TaxID=3127660 RepID=UPI00310B037E
MARILIVDDVPANLQILNVHLTDEEYEVIESQSGQHALEVLAKDPELIDLVLLDVMMPVMSGLDVLAQIKRNPLTEHIPVILVTANADDQKVAEGLDMGAFDYIIKPYSLVVLLARVRAALREKERQDLLEKWATTDPLTELMNRRHFFELADRELEQTRRSSRPLSFIMVDIDYFKQVNDVHGHLIGDAALIKLAELLKDQLRKVDFCGRYGGEEFVLCLPNTPAKGAFEVAERIRDALAHIKIDTPKGGPLTFTISLGIAQNNNDNKVEDILKRADKALYEAKESGRNQTKTAN